MRDVAEYGRKVEQMEARKQVKESRRKEAELDEIQEQRIMKLLQARAVLERPQAPLAGFKDASAATAAAEFVDLREEPRFKEIVSRMSGQ